ncbi:MAG: 1-deoxy-D-xylulose-5-phosphate reductoisomerase [Nitrospiraceae bacterium]|jgi:1-deoxy-D-xylulose-5-phosphate reductoisomerase|uniref:1-deoxy-D-xylulose-5-phosphate reductoisomerase n=1 Tax=Nitrospira cf. moscoviensis SBR1015 TaxID=96242 RepID=UPI000A0CAA66|nr:1-deoxy-D-xylulose-5-phosphate reductoisomerase [Nitrospira cf. moscoviensis SBR1015]MBH0204220.1 1-deoxy-D-xylulose-5-phosphate reductoisomerase [Nitrospira sp.]MBY0249230.1 1-deoxy-D-xylulose-5-phosphate reductoisomerase [Nitrospiraceae bacterium]OQW34327.1 MAG: 1-deoxy-D-xylulose-5-phosphate reductoisomerase [Nitrospira sp. SG-bin2]
MKSIIILGSTGSIGTNTLDIVQRFPEDFRVVGLTAGGNVEKLEAQIRAFNPQVVAVSTESSAAALRTRCAGLPVEILAGEEGIAQVAAMPGAELVISAIVGAAGLLPTLAAIRSGKHIALANKEPMVMAGKLMQEEARKHGVRIFPVDSEHSAIFQSLEGHRLEDVRRLILTASGGALWTLTKAQLQDVTPERALQHPNWKMGSKITIDSATLMNKGLEVVEARWLFDIGESRIDVLIHRESIIHSLVEYEDRSMIAQLGLPDMRTPISYAMRYPERMPLDLPSLDLTEVGKLTFCKPDHDRFPCLNLGYESLRIGGTMPAAMNAANEVAVDAFLNGGLRFIEIADVIRNTMHAHTHREITGLEDALEADRWAREKAGSLVHALPR